METFSAYVPKLLPRQEQFLAGRRSCKGCGKALAARIASKALGHDGPAPGPGSGMQRASLPGSYGFAHSESLTDDLLAQSLRCFDSVCAANSSQTAAGGAAQPKPVVAVSRRALEAGGTVLARALGTHPDMLVLCLDNEPTIDRLISRAIPRPFQLNERCHAAGDEDVAATLRAKNMPPLALTDAFTYRATACPSYPFDLISKIQKGLAASGSAFILALTPCPTGWMFPPRQTLAVGAAAVRSGWFPLYEIDSGGVSITHRVRARLPVSQYMAMQQRFFTLPGSLLPGFQREIDVQCKNLEQADSAHEPLA